MDSNSIPAIAYGFVGITALVLTYVTLADSTIDTNASKESTTSMLPTIEPFTESKEELAEPVVAEPVVTKPIQEAVGGKKTKGGKKSRLNNKKKTNKKNKTNKKI